MKKNLFIIMSFSLCISLFAQKSKIMEFPSRDLNETRILKIYVPKSYKKDGDRVYPLTIILDSEHLFDVYLSNAELFAKKDKAPEQIIVGIFQNQNKERYQDCNYDKASGMPTEKGMAFYTFIGNELLNYLDNNYRISPFKTIVGNTLTANFINYFLIGKTSIFQSYINLNPKYNEDITSMLHAKIPTIKEETYYYIISGDYNGKTKQDRIRSVDNLLKSSQNEMFEYKYDEMNHSTKTASIGQGIAGSLAFTFELYSAISKEEYAHKVSKLSPPEAIEYLEKKYVEIEYLFGANIKIRERDIYAIEGIIIDQENGDYLEEFGKMINRLYPESPVGDYYIGKYYETGKEYKKALKYYKNGFSKISADDPNKVGYYQNVERILKLRSSKKVEKNSEEEDSYDEEKEKNTPIED